MASSLKAFQASLPGQKIAIIGAGISNRPLIRWLYPQNSKLTVFDMMMPDDPLLLSIQADFDREGIRPQWITGPGYLDRLTGFDLIFRTPRMRTDLAPLQRAREAGARIDSEIALFARLCPAPIYGITGSDGKTTTTSLVSRMLEEAGFRVHTGGNIGTPLIDRLEEIQPTDRVVLELSSFQLMDMKERIHTALITNIIPNHLDFHLDYEEYQEAKKNIFRYQEEGDVLVLNAKDPVSSSFAGEKRGPLRFFNKEVSRAQASAWREGGRLWLTMEGGRRLVIMEEDEILLPGSFNLENILAAALATAHEVPPEAMARAGRSFRGVDHRMELVDVIDGVRWHNSSVDSSPSRTIKTLSAFKEEGIPVVLISGGQDKNSDYRGLGRAIAEISDRIILCGQNADLILASLKEESEQGGKPFESLQIEVAADYPQALQMAKDLARPGEAVLFSPAGTSYDRYRHFEDRGRHFKDLVERLARGEKLD